MQCPSCRHDLPPGAEFCPECGVRQSAACARCGQPSAAGYKFCPRCGQPLAVAPAAPEPARFAAPNAYTPRHLAEKILTSRSALEGERKLVTVLFCDIADSTRLAERLGPEAMHALLSRFFDLALEQVHRYEGTVNQFLGDGFMALFGAPVAHEDHPRRAVLAAVGIQRALEAWAEPPGARVAVRMGLNTGTVLVGAIGDNLRMDYTAVGDTTNLAARLQQAAEPGAVLVSEAVRRLVEGSVRLDPVGPLAVKGKAAPVAAYRVSGIAPSGSRGAARPGRSLSRFAGRERELGLLGEALDQAERGHGQVAGIVAEPGAGKSRLVDEFRERLAAGRATCLEGRCLSYSSAIPLVPVLDLLRQQAGLVEADAPETVAGKLRGVVAGLGLDPDESLPYLLHIAGVKHGPEPAGSPEAVRARAFLVLRQLALAESRRRPLVLVVEDLHWVDRTSEAFLESLVDALPGARILLVATYRPGYRPPWIDRSYASQVALRPLSPADSLTVLASVLGATDGPLVRLVLDKAEGNPFFIEELARAVRGDAAGAAVPDTIQGVLMARIDRLAEEPRRLLQAAAVVGREVPLRLLGAIAEAPDELDRHLGELTRLEFLFPRVDAEEPAYAFKHALTQEVAYQSLVTARRRALHARAGAALEALFPDGGRAWLLAYHFREAGDLPRALRYQRRAAEAAGRVYAVQEALDHYAGALDVAAAIGPDAAGDARQLHLERGRVLARAGELGRARADFEAALDAARAGGDRRAEMEALDELGFLLAGAADYREATPRLMAALAIAEALGDGPAQAMILSRLAIMEANHLQLAEAVAHAHRAIEQARALDDARALDRALDSLLVASMMLGDVPTCDRVGGLLVERLRARGDLWYLQFALTQWGSARLAAGHWDDALARFRESLQISRRIGDRANEPMFLTQECWAWRTRGDYRRALAVGHQALELARGLEHREWIAWSAAHLGWTLEEIAAVGEAAGRFEQGLAAARRAGSAFHVLNLTGHLAWAAWLTGDPARAAALAEEAEAMAGRATVPPGQAVLDAAGAYLGIARVRLATGDPASAERLIRPVLAAAEAGWVDVAARAGLVLAACRRALGDPAGAAQAAERARAAAAATGLPAVLWQAHAELAVLAEAGGRADEAAAHRRAAEPVVERLAATLDPGPVREAYARAALDALREGRCLPGAPAG